MRLSLQSIVRLASVPIGVGVGLWMAFMTSLPYCPVQGLGTRDLCAAQPTFAPGLCILCGATATAMVILISLVVRPPAGP